MTEIKRTLNIPVEVKVTSSLGEYDCTEITISVHVPDVWQDFHIMVAPPVQAVAPDKSVRPYQPQGIGRKCLLGELTALIEWIKADDPTRGSPVQPDKK